MEVYIDAMLVKSTTAELHIAHLVEAFLILKEYNMKLNPAKCAFGVSAEKFLGFIVNNRGIEANPDKIKAMLDMPSPSSIKEVQRLTGRIVALSRFISRASDKCQPFFQILKKAFQWDARYEEAFVALKTYLSSPPPPPPHPGKSLRGRDPYSVPDSFRFLNQRRPDQRQRPSAAPSLLLQPSSERSRGEVSKDGETNPGIGNHSPETPPLLPSAYHRNPNIIPDEASAT